MAYELVYTSAPEGVMRGSYGFCVVACTRGMNPRLVATLEALSAYKPLYPHYADNAWDNPVSRSHYIYDGGGARRHILSRVCFNGVDHTRRSNKLASHLVLDESEAAAAAGGPGSLLLREELFKDASWPIHAEMYESTLTIPETSAREPECPTWQEIMGDAGWGGFMAQSFLEHPERNIYLAYDPAQQAAVIRLFDEAINLLPADKRWLVTFNTYFVTLPAGMSCAWRGVPLDSEALLAARHSPANLIIDLTKPRPCDGPGELAEAARRGIRPTPSVSPKPRAVVAADPQKVTPSRKHIFVIDDEPENPAVLTPVEPDADKPRRRWWLWAAIALAAMIVAAGAVTAVAIAVDGRDASSSSGGGSSEQESDKSKNKKDDPKPEEKQPEAAKTSPSPAVAPDKPAPPPAKPAPAEPKPAKSAPVKPAPVKPAERPISPKLLWLDARALYRGGSGIVTIRLGATPRNKVFIRLDQDKKRPGEVLRAMNDHAEDVTFETAYNNDGSVTIQVKDGLLGNDGEGRFSVLAGDEELPLFFALGISRLDGGKCRYSRNIKDSGKVTLKIENAKLPKRIYLKDRPQKDAKYRLRCDGIKVDMTPDVGSGMLTGTYTDRELDSLRETEHTLMQLKMDLEESPEALIEKAAKHIPKDKLGKWQKLQLEPDDRLLGEGLLSDLKYSGNSKIKERFMTIRKNSPYQLYLALQEPEVRSFLGREENKVLRERAEKLEKKLQPLHEEGKQLAKFILDNVPAESLGVAGEKLPIPKALEKCRTDRERRIKRLRKTLEKAKLFIVVEDGEREQEFEQIPVKAQ